MEEEAEYFVIDTDGRIIGPITPFVISHLVSTWSIGPDSPIRHGAQGSWQKLKDVSVSLGIELKQTENWEVEQKQVLKEERKNIRIGCLASIFIGWVVLWMVGWSFIVVPMILVGIIYVSLCKLFSHFSGIDILSLPMWTDVRVKRLPGQGLQFLAFTIALTLVAVYYSYRRFNQ